MEFLITSIIMLLFGLVGYRIGTRSASFVIYTMVTVGAIPPSFKKSVKKNASEDKSGEVGA